MASLRTTERSGDELPEILLDPGPFGDSGDGFGLLHHTLRVHR